MIKDDEIVMVCYWCRSSNLTCIVVNPCRFREERSNPTVYICGDCGRLNYADK